MKKIFLMCGLMITSGLYAQTLYVPSGTSGIGSSPNGNVGVGTSNAPSKLTVNGDIQMSNAAVPMGLMSEVGGTTPLLNFSVNFREPDKNIAYRGAGFRIDTREGTPLYQWLKRDAQSTTDNIIMVLLQNGNFGVGTAAPGTAVSVSSGAEDQLHLSRTSSNAGDNIYLAFSHGNNTSPSNGRVRIGANIKADGAGRMVFQTGYQNATTEKMRIDENGNVGIGTTNPNQKLTVNGIIYGREVLIDQLVPGPDYVFEKDYDLPSLDDVRSYIEKHKHLPEVPSAKEMEANGINVGEMEMILLKKVEELTLYLIDLKQENKLQKQQIEKLEEQIKTH